MDHNFSSRVLHFYAENNWKGVLDLNETSDLSVALKLLWIWPSIDNLRFISNTIEKNNCIGITSIGCGCGLLEWIIEQASGIQVLGYEVNKEWWDSKYSPPKFIKLNYFNYPLEDACLDPHHALLFCYFNNGPAFRDYVDSFKGNIVIIIGPGKGKGRHTDPSPFTADFGNREWRLDSYQEIKDSKDFIVVYVRHKF